MIAPNAVRVYAEYETPEGHARSLVGMMPLGQADHWHIDAIKDNILVAYIRMTKQEKA